MLIKLDLVVEDLATLSVDELHALDNIGMSIFCGVHIVVGKRAVLASLAACPNLGPRARSAFGAAMSQALEVGRLRSFCARWLTVTKSALEPISDSEGWIVPLKYLRQNAILSAPTLLAENLTDAKLYGELGRWYAYHVSNRSTTCQVSPRGGGGSTVADELNEIVQAIQPIVLCIVDSDRQYPSDKLGETCKRCKQVLPENKWHAWLELLDVRELENLLPPSWLRKTLAGGAPLEDAIHILEMSSKAKEKFFRKYANVKDGGTACSFARALPTNGGELLFAEITYLKGSSHACGALGSCQLDRPCIVLAPLGPASLNTVLKWIQSAPARDTKEVATDPLLAKVAKLVFECGISMPRVRA